MILTLLFVKKAAKIQDKYEVILNAMPLDKCYKASEFERNHELKSGLRIWQNKHRLRVQVVLQERYVRK